MGNFLVVPLLHSVSDMDQWQNKEHREELNRRFRRAAHIKKKGLEWVGHLLERTDHGSIVKKMFESQLGERAEGEDLD